jgi:S-adenosylmethionine hydrolase
MQIITLTSDTGLQDFYVAAMKGTILNLIPNAVIIDISHSVKPFDVAEAAYQIQSCYRDFPKGTIHIVAVDSEPLLNVQNPSYPTIMKFRDQFFISNDNGFFGTFLDESQPDELYRFTSIENDDELLKFPTKNCLIPIAAKIAEKKSISSFASPINSYKKAFVQKPIIEQFVIQGTVIHIDSFGNLITNISKSDFARFGDNTPFTIYYVNKNYFIDRISKTYNEVSMGERVAIFNSNDLLEIAINRGANGSTGGADKLFGVRLGDIFRVEFSPAGSRKDFGFL